MYAQKVKFTETGKLLKMHIFRTKSVFFFFFVIYKDICLQIIVVLTLIFAYINSIRSIK